MPAFATGQLRDSYGEYIEGLTNPCASQDLVRKDRKVGYAKRMEGYVPLRKIIGKMFE